MREVQLPKNYDPDKYQHPSVTVDLLIFAIDKSSLKLLLIKRRDHPYKDMWAIPGGFVKMVESLEAAAKRELKEETGITDVYLEQLKTFGAPKRDPRTRVITVAYLALLPSPDISFKAGSDAKEAAWHSVDKMPELAFDHADIIAVALERLRGKVKYSNIVFSLMPVEFPLSLLQKTYETVLGHKLDKRNFRKRMLSLGILESTNKTDTGAHRPGQIFRFKKHDLVIFD